MRRIPIAATRCRISMKRVAARISLLSKKGRPNGELTRADSRKDKEITHASSGLREGTVGSTKWRDIPCDYQLMTFQTHAHNVGFRHGCHALSCRANGRDKDKAWGVRSWPEFRFRPWLNATSLREWPWSCTSLRLAMVSSFWWRRVERVHWSLRGCFKVAVLPNTGTRLVLH